MLKKMLMSDDQAKKIVMDENKGLIESGKKLNG